MKPLPENFLRIQQGTAEWFNARIGCVTASRVADAVNFLKSGKSSQRREDYKMELLTEILTGVPAEHYVSPAMDFGIQNEPLGREAYQQARGVELSSIGFVTHPHIKRAGASPDALLIDQQILVEIKVPNTVTHLRYLIDGVVPEQYVPQITWQLACTGYKACDFVSYDPRLPEDFSLFIVRHERDEKAIAAMEAGVLDFQAELHAMLEKLTQYRTLESELRESVARASVPRAEMPELA